MGGTLTLVDSIEEDIFFLSLTDTYFLKKESGCINNTGSNHNRRKLLLLNVPLH